jgi:predicted MFS family arabinose efflux permease
MALAVAGVMLGLEWLGRGQGTSILWMITLAMIALACLLRIRRQGGSLRRPFGIAAPPTAASQLATGAMLVICFSACGSSLQIIINNILQESRGHSPYISGMIQIPHGLGAFLSILFFGRYLLKKNGRFVICAGAVVLCLAAFLIMLAGQRPDWPIWALLPVMALGGIGVGMTSGCIGPASMARVAPEDAGASAAALRLGQQIGLALGGAMIIRPYFHHVEQPALLPSHLLVIMLLLATAVILSTNFPKPLFPERLGKV